MLLAETVYACGVWGYNTKKSRLLGPDTLLTTEIYLNLSPEHVVEELQQNGIVKLTAVGDN